MKVTRKALQSAVDKGILSGSQADQLIEHLTRQPATGPTFNFTHVLYYLGGFIAINAMTLFMNLGWMALGGLGIFLISLVYAAIGLRLTSVFQAKGYAIPAGICATFVVALTPLAIYGLQDALGFWPQESDYREYHRYIKAHWLYMELGTLLVGGAMAWRYRYPFLVLPIAVTLWYMTMDVTVMIYGEDSGWALRKLVSLYGGLLMIAFAFWVDVRTRNGADYAFWLYLFGVLAFWCGLSWQQSDSEWSKLLYFCINLLMIGAGVLLVRRVFVVFGALGACGYLGYLAHDLFADSVLFPMALTVLGLLVIYLGIVWQKNEQRITQRAHSVLPVALRELLESKQS